MCNAEEAFQNLASPLMSLVYTNPDLELILPQPQIGFQATLRV